MIFKYELRFVAESLLVGHNFMSSICKLKPKTLKTYNNKKLKP